MRPWLLIVWFAGLVLAAAASWLIWTYLPIYATAAPGDNLRFGIALVPLVLWAAVPVVFGRAFSKSASPAESATVRDHRRSVVAFLANRGIKGRRARYSLPFFLVVGPPGSGKTSLLERSDMKLGMPMTIGSASWWVGPDAVYIETSFGSPDAKPRDVFELLRSLRPKLPVNATLVVISPADLTLSDLAEQRMVTQAVTDGLRTLDEVTRTSIPAYLVLSKTDLVPGFREFFDRYEPQEREQPWGFVLPYDGMAHAKPREERHGEIDRGFRDILEAMRVRHMEWLSREADPVRCGHLQSFAAQIAAMQKTITPLLETLAPEQDRSWKGVLLRGIFLTSAHQEPLSIDALLPELSRRFAMPRIGMLPPDLGLDEEEYGYFISGILKKVILPEAGLVVRGRRRGAGGILQWAAIGVIILACAGTGYWIFQTFDREVKLAGQVAEQASVLKPVSNPAKQADLAALLQSLDGLNTIDRQLTAPQRRYEYALGLSARPPLSGALARGERGMRVNALVLHLAARLEAELVDMNADVGTLRQRLAVAEEARNLQSPLLVEWVARKAAAMTPDDRAVLETQGPAAIREAGGLRIGAAYLDAARRIIAYKESLT